MYPQLEILGVQLSLYPVFMGISWALGYILIKEQLQKNNWSIPSFEFLFAKLFIASWFGSKLAYMISIDGMKVSNFFSLNFLLGGGFVFYGGFITGSLVFIYYLYRNKENWQSFTTFIPAIAISHGVGRIGCFLAGCCYGTHCDLPWAISLHDKMRHPVQLYEAILLISFGIWGLRKVLKRNYKNLIYYYVGFYAFSRFTLEFFRGDSYRGIYVGLSFSQWIALVVTLVTLCTFLHKQRNSH